MILREPRAPQIDMLRGLRKGPRIQLIGSMGLGKSGAMILHAKALANHISRWPGVLLFAPLQVAFNWHKEIPLWVPGLRVEIIHGELAERKAALQRGADITIVTYDHIPWFEEYVGTHPWSVFGMMAMCDESTKIKSTRVAQMTSSLGNVRWDYNGGVQTNALARHAAELPYWVNATGTPTPNGLIDVWGQYWYIDRGLRLGTSFSRFQERWFVMPKRYDPMATPTVRPGAMEEISHLTADVTAVARVEDYYPDLAKPNIIDKWVELPPKARKIYQDMKSRMSAEVKEGKEAAVLTAGAKNNKLLQIGSGFAYWKDEDEDPDAQLCEMLHEAKLDVVESIMNETGEPLVVVYYYKATLHQMRKRFKKRLTELDSQGKVQEAWNEGKVRLLAIQYQEGAHGLSLQHGGRNICLLTPTYNAEHYGQILERLGPLRQMQSGYSRVVNVFRVMAEKTEDERVFDVPIGKISYQQAMIDFIQELTQ